MGMNKIENEATWENDIVKERQLEREFEKRLVLPATCRSNASPTLTDEKESSLNGDALDNENWRFPELIEVIADLRSCDDDVKLNAAAYLQHLTYRNDSIKSSARELNAFAPLVEMLLHQNQEVIRSALGALRNLSCGRVNDLNKVEIMKVNGIQVLTDILRTSGNHAIVEMTSGLLWNLSSCPALKEEILQRSVDVVFNYIIMPLLCCISSDTCQPPSKLNFSNFRHASGIFRNVSSSGKESRARLRRHGGLVGSLLSFVSWSLKHRDVDEKSVENCLCTLRNLSYNLEECCSDGPQRSRSLVGKSDAKKLLLDSTSPGCFRTRKSSRKQSIKSSTTEENLSSENSFDVVRLMLRSEVIAMLLHLLHTHSNNFDICEAVLGTIQNLCIPDWQQTVDVRESTRKCQGLPLVVQNLTTHSDKVVVAASSLCKVLATNHINKEIIGQTMVEHLLSKPPPSDHESSYSVEVYSLLATAVFECIGHNLAFARNVLVTGGIKQLSNIVQSPASFGIRASQLASIMLKKIWSFGEIHEDMRIRGLKKSDFMIEPPKKTSTDCLSSCVNEFEGRSKKVRFVESSFERGPTARQNNNDKLNVIPSTLGNPSHPVQTHLHTSTSSCKAPRAATALPPSFAPFVSNTIPGTCSSFPSSSLHPLSVRTRSSSSASFPATHNSIMTRQINSSIFPCCYSTGPSLATLRFPQPAAVSQHLQPANSTSTNLLKSQIASMTSPSKQSIISTPTNSWV